MSDAPDRDLLAAEFVLGTLEGDEAAEATRLLETDAVFAAAVRDWEERLTPLAAGLPPVAPSPQLWERIEATTAPSVVEPFDLRRRLRIWQASTGAALALAASLAAFVVLRSPPPVQVAVLTPGTGGVPVLLATAEANGMLRIRPDGALPDGAILVPADRDLELWALGAGETRPHSLGVMPASGTRVAADLAPGTQLMVSLEPHGGSPTGQPTGPVLYGGRLTARE